MEYELIGNEIWYQDENLSPERVVDKLNLNSIAIKKCRETFDKIRTVLDRDCATGDNLGDCVVRKIDRQAAEIERLKKALIRYEIQELNTRRVNEDNDSLLDFTPPTGAELAEAERIAKSLHTSGYEKVFKDGCWYIFKNGIPEYVFTNDAGCDAMLAKLRADALIEAGE